MVQVNQENSFPSGLFGKIHDLSEFLGHLPAVSATIDVKLENSHYYFKVDRSSESYERPPYQQIKSTRSQRRNYLQRTRVLEKKNQDKTFVPVTTSDDQSSKLFIYQ